MFENQTHLKEIYVIFKIKKLETTKLLEQQLRLLFHTNRTNCINDNTTN